MSSTLTNLNRVLDSPRALAAVLGAIGAAYILAYLGHPVLPGNLYSGWWTWWDQSAYFKCAANLSKGTLNKDTYLYPLGYSLVAAPFYPWAPNHPFFLPNLLFVLGAAGAFLRIARRLVQPIEVYALLLLFVFFYRGMLLDTLVVPWNTIPTQFLLYAILYLTAFTKPALPQVYAAIGCLAVMYVFKFPEFICAIPSVMIAILGLRDRRQILRTTCVAVVAICSVIGAILMINLAVFGHLRSSYDLNSQTIGVFGNPILWKVYLLFISGGPIFRESNQMILSHFPWLLLTVPGLVYVVQKYRSQALGLIFALALIFGIYVSYNDLWPDNIFHNLLIHYLGWTFPLLALITYVGLKHAYQTRVGRWSFCSIPVLVAIICFVTLRESSHRSFTTAGGGEIAIPAQPGQRVDWVLLHSESANPLKITADHRELHTPGDYRNAAQPGGRAMLLSSEISSKPLIITPQNPGQITGVEFGQLIWTFRWSPKWFLREWSRRFAPVHVSRLGKVAGIDFAGPAGQPDGVPDQVVYVDLPSWVAREISQWRIELTASAGCWVSLPDVYGHGLLKVDAPAALQPGNGRSVIRLCFADNGAVDNAPEVFVLGKDLRQQVVIESVAQR